MKKKYAKLFDSKNRALSDIISTLLLVAITIVGVNIDTAALSFKFSFLTSNLDGDIKFVDGKAKLIFKDLPVGQTGDLKLEIFEADKLRLSGEIKALKLEKGTNRQKLIMKLIDDEGIKYAEAKGKFTPLTAEETLNVDDMLIYREGDARIFDELRAQLKDA